MPHDIPAAAVGDEYESHLDLRVTISVGESRGSVLPAGTSPNPRSTRMTEVSETMVDRVARATIGYMDCFAAVDGFEPTSAEWSDYSPREKLVARLAAHAAIDAYRASISPTKD